MSYLDRLKAEFPENTLDRQLPKLPKPSYGSNGSSPPGHFLEIEGANKADADRAATVQAETADLREHLEERAGILEYDAGLARPEAELEATKMTATRARNRGYSWAALRSALGDYPALLATLPDKAGGGNITIITSTQRQ